MEQINLRENLECPICTLVPHKTKILACSIGHQICQNCYNLIPGDPKKCPQGRCKYNSPPTQFLALESMINQANIELNCKNAVQGCQVELQREELEKHELDCQYRMVTCPETDCQQNIVRSLLDDHFRENDDHGERKYGEEDIQIKPALLDDDNNIDWPTRSWEEKGFVFWRVFIKRENLWYTWLVMDTGPKEAALWNYSVKVENKKTGRSATASTPVSPVDWTVEEILSSGNYLAMTSTTVKKLMKGTSRDYSVLPLEHVVNKVLP